MSYAHASTVKNRGRLRLDGWVKNVTKEIEAQASIWINTVHVHVHASGEICALQEQLHCIA